MTMKTRVSVIGDVIGQLSKVKSHISQDWFGPLFTYQYVRKVMETNDTKRTIRQIVKCFGVDKGQRPNEGQLA